MKIFFLEDDDKCNGIVTWLRDSANSVKVVRTIEDAAYYLEYEEEYREFDKFILDASLLGASILHVDGEQKEYNGALNGIDFMMDIFPKLGIDMQNASILTAFESMARNYLNVNYADISINIINKNDSDLTRRLLDFLNSNEERV